LKRAAASIMTESGNKIYALVDMGTTNTRLSLCDQTGRTLAMAKGGFGVKNRAATGDRGVLVKGLAGLTGEALKESGLEQEDICMMLCSGMITSEVGLQEIPHLTAPVSLEDLAANAREMSLPEIGPMPVVFIPGIKNRVKRTDPDALSRMDFMRGEETQVIGAIELYRLTLPATFMFLSSHTKLVDVDHDGRIQGSFTTMSGQIFNSFRYQSLLASSLPAEDPEHLQLDALLNGVKLGLKFGLQRSGLLIRFMDVLADTTPQERFAFLEGIVVASDLRAIENSFMDLQERVYLLGNRLRAEAYQHSLKRVLNEAAQFHYLGEASMDDSAQKGALHIAAFRK
jgi:2-dehydro-3-deoxygalactonokinase